MGPRIAVEGEGEGDNISFRVRLPDNILNHVLVISGVNYTSGFPLELARGVPMHLRAKLYESGLRREWWFLAASILRSEAESIDQLLGLIDELEAFLHDSKTPRNLKTAINREEYDMLASCFPDVQSWEEYTEDKTKHLSRNTLNLLKRAIIECHRNFYGEYWKRRGPEIQRLAETLKKTVDIVQPLKALKNLLNMTVEENPIVHPVDVFRCGGGIYGVNPNRILCTSDRWTPALIHLDIAHEYGHILIGQWKMKLSEQIVELARKMEVKRPILLSEVIEEHVVALIQFKLDLKLTGIRRKTHGYMDNFTFKLAEKAWDKTMESEERDFLNYMKTLLNRIPLDKEASKELKSLTTQE